MKKLNFYLLLGLLMSMAVNFTACSKDDEEETKTVSNADFIGLWQSESYSGREIKDGVVVEEEKGIVDEYRFKFDEKGNYIEYGYEDIHNEGWCPLDSGAWQYKDGKLYLYNSGKYTKAITVKSITATNMVLEWYDTEMTSEGNLFEYYEEETYKKIDE